MHTGADGAPAWLELVPTHVVHAFQARPPALPARGCSSCHPPSSQADSLSCASHLHHLLTHPGQQEPGARPPYLSEVHLAQGDDVLWLHARLRQLCEPWGTPVEDGPRGRLRIPLQEGPVSQ